MAFKVHISSLCLNKEYFLIESVFVGDINNRILGGRNGNREIVP